MKGYAGKLLFVDLTNESYEYRDLDEQLARDFLGGYGIGAKILYEEMPAHTEPFAPESMLGFITGALNGTSALLAGRYMVVSKSPVYKGWNDANSGGSFGPFMRMAGVDGIFFKGIASHPVYLFIDDGNVEIRDASHLWGMRITEVTDALIDEIGDKRIGIASIGPGGERMAWTAAIMNDKHRACGRGGTGAVMGSKKLKAVVVRGTHKLEKADAEALKALNKATRENQKTGPEAPIAEFFSHFGTNGTYPDSVLTGDASVKNWKGAGVVDLEQDQIAPCASGETDKGRRIKNFACNACPIGCGAIYSLDYGDYHAEETGRPEYETTGMFGSMMLNGNPDVINTCNHIINEYALDTISVGATIAWAMEMYEDGHLSKDDLNGIELTWGNGDAIIAMTEAVCKGEGIGAILQNGSRFASKHFQVGDYALATASGIELAQHDPRNGPGLSRTYMIDPTPGRHVKGGLGALCGFAPPEVKYVYDDKGEEDANNTCEKEADNAAGFCEFSHMAVPPGMWRELTNAVTGFDYTPEEWKNLGLRIFIQRAAFNIREGFLRDHWYLDDRMLGKPPLEEGPLTGITIDAETMVDEFLKYMGFDVATGVPLRETMERIGGLEHVIADIYGD